MSNRRTLTLPQSSEAATAEAWTRNAGPIIDAAIMRIYGFRPVDQLDPEVRFNLTSTALTVQLQNISGRRNLVWVSHGALLSFTPHSRGEPIDFTRPMQMLAGKLEQAQIVVYAVQQSANGAGEVLVTGGTETLNLFTKLTGGRMYRTDNADVAITQARLDSWANCQIEYYTETPNADRKRHKVRAICTRKEVHLQTEQRAGAIGFAPD